MNAIKKQIALNLIQEATDAIGKIEAFLRDAEAGVPHFVEVLTPAPKPDGGEHGEWKGASYPAQSERTALNYCLVSSRHSLDVSRLIIQRPVDASSQEALAHNRKMMDDAKLAGRAAYLSALSLCDPAAN
jgi:hypothetical protein